MGRTREDLLCMVRGEGGESLEQEAASQEDMRVHVTTWHAIDEEEGGGDDEDEDDEKQQQQQQQQQQGSRKRYVIRAFGVTETGRSACVRIEGFTPFFYVKLPPQLSGKRS